MLQIECLLEVKYNWKLSLKIKFRNNLLRKLFQVFKELEKYFWCEIRYLKSLFLKFWFKSTKHKEFLKATLRKSVLQSKNKYGLVIRINSTKLSITPFILNVMKEFVLKWAELNTKKKKGSLSFLFILWHSNMYKNIYIYILRKSYMLLERQSVSIDKCRLILLFC